MDTECSECGCLIPYEQWATHSAACAQVATLKAEIVRLREKLKELGYDDPEPEHGGI